MGRALPLYAPTLCVFVACFLLFVLLRSKDPLAVDGALRSLDVYRSQRFFLHPNNHMLYPGTVLAWTTLLAAVGADVANPWDYFSAVQVMNCLAAAGCLAIFFFLACRLTSWRLALLGVVLLGLSKAFVAQATNANEPMVAIFWSFAGLACAAHSFRTGRLWSTVVSGMLFALAMATYRSAILFAPAALFLISQHGDDVTERERRMPRRVLRAVTFAASGLIAVISIYGWAYHQVGISQPGEFVERFLAQGDTRVYFEVTAGKFVNLAFGLPRNLFPVMSFYVGIRELLSRPASGYVPIFLLTIAQCGLITLCVIQLCRAWTSFSRTKRIGIVAASVGLAFSAFPLLAWSPHYDKLWIQPLACLVLLLIVSVDSAWVDRRAASIILRAGLVAMLGGVLWNLTWVVPSRGHAPQEIDEAWRLARLVGPNDLVVGEWDAISSVYGHLWAPKDRFLSFNSEAVDRGYAASARLHAAVTNTVNRGGHVYFVALLDVPKTTWDAFLGKRCGVPFSALDRYRGSSPIVDKFKSRYGDVLLREYQSEK